MIFKNSDNFKLFFTNFVVYYYLKLNQKSELNADCRNSPYSDKKMLIKMTKFDYSTGPDSFSC